jgi:succinate-semialdehyde dehydrogenase/glutarate-semialdehyde dehydrogenase
VLRYTETQAVATQRLLRFAPVLGMSDEMYGRVMTATSMKLLKRLGRA